MDLLGFSSTELVMALPAIKIIGGVDARFDALNRILKLCCTHLAAILDVIEIFVRGVCVLGGDAASVVSTISPRVTTTGADELGILDINVLDDRVLAIALLIR